MLVYFVGGEKGYKRYTYNGLILSVLFRLKLAYQFYSYNLQDFSFYSLYEIIYRIGI